MLKGKMEAQGQHLARIAIFGIFLCAEIMRIVLCFDNYVFVSLTYFSLITTSDQMLEISLFQI